MKLKGMAVQYNREPMPINSVLLPLRTTPPLSTSSASSHASLHPGPPVLFHLLLPQVDVERVEEQIEQKGQAEVRVANGMARGREGAVHVAASRPGMDRPQGLARGERYPSRLHQHIPQIFDRLGRSNVVSQATEPPSLPRRRGHDPNFGQQVRIVHDDRRANKERIVVGIIMTGTGKTANPR
mmetsp:Transcript_29304/g.54359  ORF Transcript_29304/g.54359 Transcript_29304/m.54359 type:complete len:183 (+) Transcript_29304:483-1031(+)